MASNLQQLADGLARQLERSIAIDDARMRLLASSAHYGSVDPMRSESILRRAVPQHIVDLVFTHVNVSDDLFEVPARPELGLDLSRIGYRITHEGTLSGFLWLLASEGPVDQKLQTLLAQTADEAAVIIHRGYLQASRDQQRENRLVAQLLSEDDNEAQQAAEEIANGGDLDTAEFSALMIEFDRPSHQVTAENRLALSSGLASMRSARSSHQMLALERHNHVVVLLAIASLDELVRFGESLRDTVLAHSDGANCWVGIGRACGQLTEARRSFDEAARVVSVCRRVPSFGPVVHIDSIGVYDLLSQVPQAALEAAVPIGLRELSAAGDSNLSTLETFLNNGGNVKLTSEQLFIHRTSLYYRLNRIQETTGLDLSQGDDQLRAHLGMKIIRMLDDY